MLKGNKKLRINIERIIAERAEVEIIMRRLEIVEVKRIAKGYFVRSSNKYYGCSYLFLTKEPNEFYEKIIKLNLKLSL